MSQRLIDWSNNLLPSLEANINVILQYLPDGGILYDVGANTGVITEEILKVKPNIRAWLFEPVGEFCDFMRGKFSDNPNITIVQKAISNQSNKKCKIHQHGHNLGYNYIELTEEESEVITQTLTEYHTEQQLHHNIDFIKIDVEGHEIQVMEGIEEYLVNTKKLPYILCEIGWYPEKEQAMFDKLKSAFDYEQETIENRDVLLKPKI